MNKLKHLIIDRLFSMLFGKIDVDARVYVTDTHVLVMDMTLTSRLGVFVFPIFHKELPKPLEGHIVPGGLVLGHDQITPAPPSGS